MPKKRKYEGLYYCHMCNEWHYRTSKTGKAHWEKRHRTTKPKTRKTLKQMGKKKIDGKYFTKKGFFMSKTEAKRKADWYRRYGWKARVLKGTGSTWDLYIRG